MSKYYSTDGGRTWEGPFSAEEFYSLQQSGIVDAHVLVRDGDLATVEAPAAAPTQPPPGMLPSANPVDNKVYYVMTNGQQIGPVSMAAIMQMLQLGNITPTSTVWCEGMDSWKPLQELLPAAQDSIVDFTLKGFSIGNFFSQVFTHHSKEEVDNIMCAGIKQTTPPLSQVPTGWPTPWIFARMILVCLALYFGFNWALNQYGNPLLIPGLLFVGNFGFPFCVFMFLYELNVRRDVPLYVGIKALVCGGLLSLIFALFLFEMDLFEAEGAWKAGLIEEPAKLLAVLVICGGAYRNGRVLAGLLLGAAVGAGFAAFESAGYTFMFLLEHIFGNRFADPDAVMLQRALCSFATHAVWTAITAGAYWHACRLRVADGTRQANDTSLDLSVLFDIRFLRVAIIPVILHCVWNSEYFNEFGYLKLITLGLIGWVVALALVSVGVKQIAYDKSHEKA